MSNPKDIKFICCGNEAAERFVNAYGAWCHMWDDMHDGDKIVPIETRAKVEIAFLTEVMGNPFFLANRAYFFPLIVHGVRAWLDSNSEPNQILASKLKEQYQDVIFGVAFLLGGWDHLATVTANLRKFD